jgi:hypothetical protein
MLYVSQGGLLPGIARDLGIPTAQPGTDFLVWAVDEIDRLQVRADGAADSRARADYLNLIAGIRSTAAAYGTWLLETADFTIMEAEPDPAR